MIDRPDTPHADILLEGIWEEEVTPDDLASRSLSAAQASSYAFRVASEGTVATAQLEGEVHEFIESETGSWARSFIGIVQVGESLVHVSRALGEMARNLQQVNLEQSEIVYRVEAEIEVLQRNLKLRGEDPSEQVEALIADGRERATEAAARMETADVPVIPQPDELDDGFMAFGRVPGASETFKAAVAATGNVAPTKPVSRTAAAEDAFAESGDDVQPVNGFSFGRVPGNAAPETNGANGSRHSGVDGTNGVNGANGVNGSHDQAVNGFTFGRIPSVNGFIAPTPHVEDELPTSSDDAEPETSVEAPVNGFSFGRVPNTNGVAPVDEFERTWRSPDGASDVPPVSDAPGAPSVPSAVNGGVLLGPIDFMSLGRTPSSNGTAWTPPTAPPSGPVPVVPAESAAIPMFGAAEPGDGAVGTAVPGEAEIEVESNVTEPAAEPVSESRGPEEEAALVSGFLAFGRVPGEADGGALAAEVDTEAQPSGPDEDESVDTESGHLDVVAPEAESIDGGADDEDAGDVDMADHIVDDAETAEVDSAPADETADGEVAGDGDAGAALFAPESTVPLAGDSVEAEDEREPLRGLLRRRWNSRRGRGRDRDPVEPNIAVQQGASAVPAVAVEAADGAETRVQVDAAAAESADVEVVETGSAEVPAAVETEADAATSADERESSEAEVDAADAVIEGSSDDAPSADELDDAVADEGESSDSVTDAVMEDDSGEAQSVDEAEDVAVDEAETAEVDPVEAELVDPLDAAVIEDDSEDAPSAVEAEDVVVDEVETAEAEPVEAEAADSPDVDVDADTNVDGTAEDGQEPLRGRRLRRQKSRARRARGNRDRDAAEDASDSAESAEAPASAAVAEATAVISADDAGIGADEAADAPVTKAEHAVDTEKMSAKAAPSAEKISKPSGFVSFSQRMAAAATAQQTTNVETPPTPSIPEPADAPSEPADIDDPVVIADAPSASEEPGSTDAPVSPVKEPTTAESALAGVVEDREADAAADDVDADADDDVAGTADEVTDGAPDEAAATEPAAADSAPEKIVLKRIVATAPMILGRASEESAPLSPSLQRVRDVVASVVGSLANGPYGPESGMHWSAALLVSPTEEIVVLSSTDAGWLPQGVQIPHDVRVLWNVPGAHQWAAIDDPVRALLEYAQDRGYLVEAVATTHPSRVYSPMVAGNMVGVTRVGPVMPGGLNRFEVAVSQARSDSIRAMSREDAARQVRALLRDLEQISITPENAIGFELARGDARRFLESDSEIPLPLLEQLHTDDRAVADALCLGRIPARAEDVGKEAPEADQLRDRMLERAILTATMAACYSDTESAVYGWTYARFLASQRSEAPGTT